VRGLFRWLFYLTVAFYSFCILSLLYLKFYHPPFTAVQIQRKIESLFTSDGYPKRHTFVPLSHIADHMERAAIAAEDGHFFRHHGVDWRELQKAIKDNWQRGYLWRGGSTLTQQLVKNLFLSTHGSLLRKAVEMSLAPMAELLLSKERILELYLNVVEWGPGVYGVEAASQYHYGLCASRLSREQAARLVACLPAPLSRRPQRMDRYGAEILDRMSKMGW
jgi:monofunctional biosynthetic peptidoglycan transglycosylase